MIEWIIPHSLITYIVYFVIPTLCIFTFLCAISAVDIENNYTGERENDNPYHVLYYTKFNKYYKTFKPYHNTLLHTHTHTHTYIIKWVLIK